MRKFHSKDFVTSANTLPGTQKKIVLLLAGCGARDGTEITEATSLMIALTQAGFKIDFFAPERLQMHVVDHMSGMVIAVTTANRRPRGETASVVFIRSPALVIRAPHAARPLRALQTYAVWGGWCGRRIGSSP